MEGIDYIIKERIDARNRKGYTPESDYKYGERAFITLVQLLVASDNLTADILSTQLIQETLEKMFPTWQPLYIEKLLKKSYIERLAIAGQFIAAQIDVELLKQKDNNDT